MNANNPFSVVTDFLPDKAEVTKAEIIIQKDETAMSFSPTQVRALITELRAQLTKATRKPDAAGHELRMAMLREDYGSFQKGTTFWVSDVPSLQGTFYPCIGLYNLCTIPATVFVFVDAV